MGLRVTRPATEPFSRTEIPTVLGAPARSTEQRCANATTYRRRAERNSEESADASGRVKNGRRKTARRHAPRPGAKPSNTKRTGPKNGTPRANREVRTGNARAK